MKTFSILIVVCAVCTLASCKKFLDKEPKKSLVILRTLADLQGILDDYENIINEPYSMEMSADDYYLTTADFLALNGEENRRVYTWEPSYLFGSGTATEWYFSYQHIYRANTVLEVIDGIQRTPSNASEWDNLKGQAYFLRARALLGIVNTWTSAYDPRSSSTELGVPIRLGTDFNVPSTRSTLEESYKQVIADLKEAIPLLQQNPLHVFRSSKPAALGLLARAYLFMGQYDKCLEYADNYLKIKNTLIDYNTLNPATNYPIQEFNSEVAYACAMPTPQALGVSRGKVDTMLFRTYQNGDLRKTIFFRDNKNGSYGFRGSYQGSLYLFSGIATDEVFLMRAESHARLGNLDAATDDLNTLLKSRWSKSQAFIPVSIKNKNEMLSMILLERRKELLFRGLRWPELKRLNRDGANILVSRNVNNRIYTLKPNDLRYALPIPEGIIGLTGMQQNPR